MPSAHVEGKNVYFVEQGAGVPVIFVHGAGGSHLIWGSQVHALREIAHPVAIDLPGHGQSDPPGRNTVDAYRDVVIGLMDALQFERAVIVGHSMGGAIAQATALAHPGRVAGLGLVGTGARLRVLPQILQGILTDFDRTTEFVTDHCYASSVTPEMRARAIRELRACPAAITHGDYSACNAFDMMSRIGEIRAPAVVICGREDKMTPVKYSEFLASRLPNARLVLVDGAGHSVMIEEPEAVNRALVEFVQTLR